MVTTTAAAAPFVNTNESGRVQMMTDSEHKQWWASDGGGVQTKAGRRDNGRWLVGR